MIQWFPIILILILSEWTLATWVLWWILQSLELLSNWLEMCLLIVLIGYALDDLSLDGVRVGLRME